MSDLSNIYEINDEAVLKEMVIKWNACFNTNSFNYINHFSDQ